MKFFDHFPVSNEPEYKVLCPICGTNEDKPCFLMPIDGTNEGNICQAQPTHKHCVEQIYDKLRWNKNIGIIYLRSK